jgi:uncharacterized protein YerC
MTQISKRKVKQEVLDEMTQIFLTSLSQVRNEDDAIHFIEDLLTPTERIMLAKRVAIAIMIKKGYEHETIRSILKVSRSTVSAVNGKMLLGGKGYNQILDKIIKSEKMEAVLTKIEDTVLKALSYGSGKGGAVVWKEIRKRNKQQKRSQLF